ncbi:ABC transporter substrate-binding protein [Chryseotalea sanaruensis]|uniref:ABC transporter substrate-binding protein n=1 Tax=Chryseotalea sanaruensis TaxID=2482724 RepID=A0A401UB67_9BACT|nr:ABC transporter substrate-binding protein [Chryseotalea sanaruensis]GCC52127.1 ABC transporter substrate-binding protein [Chryseotalea sanaruensis]
MRLYSLFVFALIVASCGSKKNHSNNFLIDSTYTKYAKGFRVSYKENITQVEVMKPYQGSEEVLTYWLIDAATEIPAHDSHIKIIRTPIKSIVCTSTTHIPLLDYLNESAALVGFPTTDYISSEKMRMRIDSGYVIDLGVDKGLNIEKLAALSPDVVMAYTMTGDYGQFKSIEDLGTPVVINAEYLEEHPLGRAEWIKYMALFFDKKIMADSVFFAIEQNYLQIKHKVDSLTNPKPTVMSGIVYGDAWFMPAGQNYAAKLLRDAGFNYLWSDDSTAGYLQLPFELVYDKANMAEYWIGVGSFKSLGEIGTSDNRYTKFNAYQSGKVYTYNARIGATGGSEFLELGYLRPDIILQDLVMIAHPHLFTEPSLYFHKQLN